MPMNKIDKARTVVMLTNEVRDVLLSNLNDMPEDWDGFEVRQAVLETVRGFISPIPNIARRRAFEQTFFSGNFTRKKDPRDAYVESDAYSQDGRSKPCLYLLGQGYFEIEEG